MASSWALQVVSLAGPAPALFGAPTEAVVRRDLGGVSLEFVLLSAYPIGPLRATAVRATVRERWLLRPGLAFCHEAADGLRLTGRWTDCPTKACFPFCARPGLWRGLLSSALPAVEVCAGRGTSLFSVEVQLLSQFLQYVETRQTLVDFSSLTQVLPVQQH